MKDTTQKEKFIQLCAKGLSFDKISKEISTSKPTLLKWSEEFEDEIAIGSIFPAKLHFRVESPH